MPLISIEMQHLNMILHCGFGLELLLKFFQEVSMHMVSLHMSSELYLTAKHIFANVAPMSLICIEMQLLNLILHGNFSLDLSDVSMHLMSLHMSSELCLTAKHLLANEAPMPLISIKMQLLDMILHRGFGLELLLTELTSELLRIRMRRHMRSQRSSAVERLEADLTLENV